MTRFLLDTSFAIDFLRGDPSAIGRFERLLEAGDEAVVNDVVLCELATGAPSPADPGLVAFVRAVEFVQPGPEAALHAGALRAEARARGWTVSLADALIGATAEAIGGRVLTRNVRDFQSLPITVETY